MRRGGEQLVLFTEPVSAFAGAVMGRVDGSQPVQRTAAEIQEQRERDDRLRARLSELCLKRFEIEVHGRAERQGGC